MNSKNIKIFIGVLLIAFIFIVGTIKKNSLKKNFELTNGEVYELGQSRNSGNTIFLKFRFFNNCDLVYGNTGIPCDRVNSPAIRNILLGKKAQILYDKEDINNCKILIRKSDYEEYKLPISKDYLPLINLVDSICSYNSKLYD